MSLTTEEQALLTPVVKTCDGLPFMSGVYLALYSGSWFYMHWNVDQKFWSSGYVLVNRLPMRQYVTRGHHVGLVHPVSSIDAWRGFITPGVEL